MIIRSLISLGLILMLASCGEQASKTPEGLTVVESGQGNNVIVNENPTSITDSLCSKLYNEGNQLCREGDFMKAYDLFIKCNDLESNHPTILSSLGTTSHSMGKHDQAMKFFQEAIKVDSSYIEAYASAGVCLEMQEKYAESIEILKLGLSKGNQNQFTYFNICYNLSISYSKINECQLALNFLNEAKKNGFKIKQFDDEIVLFENYLKENCQP